MMLMPFAETRRSVGQECGGVSIGLFLHMPDLTGSEGFKQT